MNDILKWQITVLLSIQANEHFSPIVIIVINDIWELLMSIQAIVYKPV